MTQRTPSLPLVLIIDELPAVVRMLQLELSFHGLRTAMVLLEDEPLPAAEQQQPAAIILGALLPTPEIYDLLVELKQRMSAPVIFLYGSGNEADGSLAREMGADEVMARPFKPDDLGLRLRNLIDQRLTIPEPITRGSLVVDPGRGYAWHNEKKLMLGSNEWGLLLALLQAEAPIPAAELLSLVWGEDHRKEFELLAQWIRRLRINVNDDPESPSIILGDLESGFWLVC